MTTIGLFGGTFDPVHYGHLRPALELCEHYALDTLYLLPNHRPQHRDRPQATSEQRIEMQNIAVADEPRLVVDAREAMRDEPTYTFDTLTEVKGENPNSDLVFFLGVDAFAKFDQWHRWQEILTLANLVVIDRPDAKLTSFAVDLIETQKGSVGETIQPGSVGVIERRKVTQLSISATKIRNQVSDHENIRFLLPDAVREYILAKGLYRS